MAKKKGQGGFTMVEMLVTVLTGSMIMFAALTIILLGVRVQKQSSEAVRQQNTARVVMEMLEDMAAENTIKSVVIEDNSWKLNGTDGELIWYDASKGTISGRSGTILNNVIASHVVLSEHNVLTIALETPAGSYTSSVFCRKTIGKPGGTAAEDILSEIEKLGDEEPQIRFLKTLASQYRQTNGMPNTGTILDGNGKPGDYYNFWYCGDTFWEGWNKDTPWCASFVSWALNTQSEHIVNKPERVVNSKGEHYYRWFANVDNFWEYFKDTRLVNTKEIKHTPNPGDIIFFDWDHDEDPQHVGVVLAVDDKDPNNKIVYTIEGNSAGVVAMCSYPVDSNEILGYGRISWEEN